MCITTFDFGSQKDKGYIIKERWDCGEINKDVNSSLEDDSGLELAELSLDDLNLEAVHFYKFE